MNENVSIMPVHLNFFDSSSSSDEGENAQKQQQPQKQRLRKKIYRDRIHFEFLSESTFIERFRVSRSTAEKVLSSIGPLLKHKTEKNQALEPKQQLLVGLHFYGTGSQYHSVGDMHGIHKSTVCRIINRVSTAILRTLFHVYIRWPNNSTFIQLKFASLADFPRVMGVVDGTLIPIEAPSLNEKDFVDRHGQHSINAMVVCGPNYEFYYASARWPGSVHDNRVLRTSTLFQKWEIEGNYFA